ncbi:hypothetical protein [Sedimentitalea sp.]|uniref:hypothetical protein n=1 Tax=Sedimentitalea sp. TaxID=2048915 RepID=UPI00329A75D0
MSLEPTPEDTQFSAIAFTNLLSHTVNFEPKCAVGFRIELKLTKQQKSSSIDFAYGAPNGLTGLA